MIKTKKVKIEKDEITDIICNKCGDSCKKDMNHIGLLEATAHGCYDSEKIGDTNSWTFSICESCLETIVKTFKIPPQEKEQDLLLESK